MGAKSAGTMKLPDNFRNAATGDSTKSVLEISFRNFEPDVGQKQYLRNRLAPVIHELPEPKRPMALVTFDNERSRGQKYVVLIVIVGDGWRTGVLGQGPDFFAAVDDGRDSLERTLVSDQVLKA